MKFESFRVTGLFGRFDHELKFRSDERIIIMIGPNGFGKTMTLRMIDILFNQPPHRLAGMPFGKVEVSFDDGSSLVVAKTPREEGQEEADAAGLELMFLPHDGEPQVFPIQLHVHPQQLDFPGEMIEDAIPVLNRVGPRSWHDRRTGKLLSLGGVIAQFGDELARTFGELPLEIPEWLQDIRKSIAVHFIDTERLTRSLPRRGRDGQRFRSRFTSGYSESYQQRTVRLYSEELAKRVQETLTEYGSLSQSLDRTFPVRLVEGHEGADYSMKHLRQELDDIEEKRSALVEAGLLAQEQAGLAIPALDGVDESRRGVLAVYAQDAKDKLGVFDDLYRKVDAFRRIANSRFLHKRVMVKTDGLSVVNADGSELDLEMLSSGEQHELVILYELLFRIPDNSLILIDEPELSLHVLWQEQFLKDLEEMAALSNFRVILATHSPEIIGDRWDLTTELRGPNGQ